MEEKAKRKRWYHNIKIDTIIGLAGLLIAIISVLVSISGNTSIVTTKVSDNATLHKGDSFEQDGFALKLLALYNSDDNVFICWQITNGSSQSIPVKFDVNNFEVYDDKDHSYSVIGLEYLRLFEGLDWVMPPGRGADFTTIIKYDFAFTSSRDLKISVKNIGTITNAIWKINVDTDNVRNDKD